MNIGIDDLQLGLWVAVTSVRNPPEPERDSLAGRYEYPSPVEIARAYQRLNQEQIAHWRCVTGKPYQIMSIDLPFIMVFDPFYRSIFPMDTREVNLKTLRRDYVLPYLRAQYDPGPNVLHPNKAFIPHNIFSDHTESADDA